MSDQGMPSWDLLTFPSPCTALSSQAFSVNSLRSLPANVLWGSLVTHSFLPHGRVLNTADIYVHQSQAV